MKKMLNAAIMLAALMLFVSCQQKKESNMSSMDKKDSSVNNGYEKPTIRSIDNPCSETIENCKPCEPCQSCKPCEPCQSCKPCQEEKCAPKDKCCTNQEEAVKEEKDTVSQELKLEENFPLEEFKASMENHMPSDITDAKNDSVEVHQ